MGCVVYFEVGIHCASVAPLDLVICLPELLAFNVTCMWSLGSEDPKGADPSRIEQEIEGNWPSLSDGSRKTQAGESVRGPRIFYLRQQQ